MEEKNPQRAQQRPVHDPMEAPRTFEGRWPDGLRQPTSGGGSARTHSEAVSEQRRHRPRVGNREDIY